NGNMTVGVYNLNLENQVKFLAFDLDVIKPVVKQFHSNTAFREKITEKLQMIVNQIIDVLKTANLNGYIEFSGNKGYHVWVFFKYWIKAELAKDLGKMVVSKIDKGDTPCEIEVFPKQARVMKNKTGNLIKIPLGIHLKTGKRSYFVNDNFFPLDFAEVAPNVKKHTLSDIIKASRIVSPDIDIEESLPFSKSDSKTENIQIDPLSDRQLQFLLQNCSTINNLIKKINLEFKISSTEIIALKHTLGHLDKGAEIVNFYLKKCYNVTPAELMKNNFSGFPISCPKLRTRLANIVDKSKCNCEFSDLLNSYPHPLLHLKRMDSSVDINNIDEWRLLAKVEDYLKKKKDFNTLKKAISLLESQLISHLNETDTNSIETSFGTLRLIKIDNKLKLQLEL
ncbi:MAG: CRISPR-associated primase-polymerase type A1, partial [Candidatus Cloacimonadota bacterium]|nr:CRISPR-associated primase-polymerase type A1 [Candidatus Cloacimonadota bacterium]